MEEYKWLDAVNDALKTKYQTDKFISWSAHHSDHGQGENGCTVLEPRTSSSCHVKAGGS